MKNGILAIIAVGVVIIAVQALDPTLISRLWAEAGASGPTDQDVRAHWPEHQISSIQCRKGPSQQSAQGTIPSFVCHIVFVPGQRRTLITASGDLYTFTKINGVWQVNFN